MPPSPKKITLRERYEQLRKAIKKNNGKSKKPPSPYTFTGQDENGLEGKYFLDH